mgnify:CR=1 FL=1
MIAGGPETRNFRALASVRGLLLVFLPIAAVTVAHYGTGPELAWVHDVLRRLYYIPIVLGAFAFGLRGALAASILTSIVYLPHAFLQSHHHHHDPGAGVEKLLELLLYNVIAIITGVLADREVRERVAQQRIARRLEDNLEELRLMEAQLVRAGRLRALGELTAGLAHEIKNPLASLKGAAEILSDEIKPDSPRRRMLDILRKELDRMEALLERFLSFARPRATAVEDVAIDDVIGPVVALVETQARKQNVVLKWTSGGEQAVVRGDKDQLTTVVVNLVLNAVQAMPRGGTVRIATERVSRGRRDWWMIRVQDEGPGVPSDLREKIFDPFVTTREGGTGMGLAIVTRVLDAHQGLVELTDRPGGGAEFRILLPAT